MEGLSYASPEEFSNSETTEELTLEQIEDRIRQEAVEVSILEKNRGNNGALLSVPHGPESKLTEDEWKSVRTETFKEWFGDWENIPISQFKTSRDSVYTYDTEGKTTRYKTAVDEQHEQEDITVFIKLDSDLEGKFNDSIHAEGGGGVWILERMSDGTGKPINDISEVGDKDGLWVGIVKDNQATTLCPAVLRPLSGYSVYETRKAQENGQDVRYRHLGHPVTAVRYGELDTSKMLLNGEPRLVQDPYSTDPEAKVAIKAVNPYATSKEEWSKWMGQNGLLELPNGDEVARQKLRESGYDGLIIDGIPAVGKDGIPYFEKNQILRIGSTKNQA